MEDFESKFDRVMELLRQMSSHVNGMAIDSEEFKTDVVHNYLDKLETIHQELVDASETLVISS